MTERHYLIYTNDPATIDMAHLLLQAVPDLRERATVILETGNSDLAAHRLSRLERDGITINLLRYSAPWATTIPALKRASEPSHSNRGHTQTPSRLQTRHATRLSRIKQRLKRHIMKMPGVVDLASASRNRRRAKNLLSRCNATHILVFHTYPGSFASQLVRTAQTLGIPAYAMPVFEAHRELIARVLSQRPRNRLTAGKARVLRHLLPKWCAPAPNDMTILRQPLAAIFAEHLMGVRYFDPWAYSGQHFDRILARDSDSGHRMTSSGHAEQSIMVTGWPQDVLWPPVRHDPILLKRQRLHAWPRYLANSEKRLLLILMPPNQFGTGNGFDGPFDDYGSVVRYWIDLASCLSGTFQIAVSPHPRGMQEQISAITAAHLPLSDFTLWDLLPITDGLVSYANSSAIEEGIRLGIPIVTLDPVGYGIPPVHPQHERRLNFDNEIVDRIIEIMKSAAPITPFGEPSLKSTDLYTALLGADENRVGQHEPS